MTVTYKNLDMVEFLQSIAVGITTLLCLYVYCVHGNHKVLPFVASIQEIF